MTVLTQEEINALVKEIEESIHKNKQLKDVIDKSEPEYACWHDWKSYHGFTDKYEYCTRCGVKR